MIPLAVSKEELKNLLMTVKEGSEKAGLEEAQAGIKNARRNINNLRYAEDLEVNI